MNDEIKLVPAICTRCGGAVEVDPKRETATCPYCGTQFIIEKAVHNYNVQHAEIEHVDNVNIDMTGSVKEVLNFVENNILESKEERMERKRQEAEQHKMMTAGFLKIFAVMMAVMMVAGVVFFIYLNATGKADEGDNTVSEFAGEQSELEYSVNNGCLYLEISGQKDGEWAFQEYDSVRTNLVSEENDAEGYQSCISADIQEGTGYAVTGYYEDGGIEFQSDSLYYSVIKVRIEDGDIVEAMDSRIIDDLSEYDFE